MSILNILRNLLHEIYLIFDKTIVLHFRNYEKSTTYYRFLLFRITNTKYNVKFKGKFPISIFIHIKNSFYEKITFGHVFVFALRKLRTRDCFFE